MLRHPLLLAAPLLLLACQRPMEEGEPDPRGAMPAPATPQAKITNAMSAAPEALARGATIMDWPATPGGSMAVLRSGTNGWTCMPDNPGTPGNDPMCSDPAFHRFLDAYMNRRTPQIDRVGLSYMLQGSADASNTDPFATQPRAGEDWVRAGPHVMVATPSQDDLQGIPTDPDNGGPWVMWAGTPYAHIMVPVSR